MASVSSPIPIDRSEERLAYRLAPSISDIPAALWDEKIAAGHPFKSHAFMAALEEAFSARRFTYVRMEKRGNLAGLAVLTQERFDLAASGTLAWVAKHVRKIFPKLFSLELAMVGTFETTKRHWWFDPEQVGEDEFVDCLLEACREVFANAALLIVRDFAPGDPLDERIQARLLNEGFCRVENLPLAIVDLDGGGIDEHLGRLKRKARQSVTRQLKAMRRLELTLDRCDPSAALIDECYPLYLAVHNKATELQRNPIPRAFFSSVARHVPGSSFLTLRRNDGRLLGFVLTGTSSSVHNPFLIGMDYAAMRNAPTYYCLLWSEIAFAAERGCGSVDLGLTSYFIKQTMGARLESLTMAARVQSKWLRPLIQPLLPKLIGARQPRQRQTMRGSVSPS